MGAKKQTSNIDYDKESLYDTIIQLKKLVNQLREENDYLKAKVQQTEEECSRKSKLLQDFVTQLKSSGGSAKIPKVHREAALITTLKEKLRESEKDNNRFRQENLLMKKNIKITKLSELEDINKAYNEECKRLRLTISLLIQDKYKGKIPENIEALENSTLSLRADNIKLREKIKELEQRIEMERDHERQLMEALHKTKEKQKKWSGNKGKITQQKLALEESQEKIAILINKVKELEENLAKKEKGTNEHNDDKHNQDAITKLTNDNSSLRSDKEKLNEKLIEKEKELLQKDKEIRDAKLKLKEQEDEWELKSLENQEKLSQRILILERELSLRNQNAPSNVVKEVAVALIQENDLVYIKELFRMLMIHSKKGIDVLQDELFCEYKPDEQISIKELAKIGQKNPLCLDVGEAEDLARYLIETRDKKIVVYNKYAETTMADVKSKLLEFLNIDYPKDFWEESKKITKGAIEKLKDRFKYMKNSINEIIASDGRLEFTKWIKVSNTVCPELSSMEKDFLIALMAGKENKLKELKFQVIVIIINRNWLEQ